jgi:ribosomal protein L12E/L44/L45/RPP1/RPP2
MNAIIGASPMFLMAAAKGGAGGSAKTAAAPAAGGAGAATGTGTEEKTESKVKEEVKVHTKLADLLKKHDAAAEKAGSLLVEVGELILRDNISNPVLIKTIMDARGVEQSTAKSQASRIRALLKDKDSFEALKRGEVTVRAAVKGAQARRAPTPQGNQKAFDNALNKFAAAAKATGQDKRTILTTVEAALDKAQIK